MYTPTHRRASTSKASKGTSIGCYDTLSCFFSFFDATFLLDVFYVGGLTRVFNNGLIDSVLKKPLANGGGRSIEVKKDFI